MISFTVTIGVNFFLSPYIVEKVGVDAYGFVGLANNFVSYASLITIALNALAGRFITVRIYENDNEGANRYFNSVLIANSVISGIMLLAMSVIWIFLDKLINIPQYIYTDVKILFAFLFFECIINTGGSVFSVSTFATNKLFLNYLRIIESNLARAAVLIVLFVFFTPRLYYIGITAALTAVYCILYNIHYTRKLLPFIKISRKYFNLTYVRELISSGIWALVIRLGQLLGDGFDLIITNLIIDPTAMGVLSLAKMLPAAIGSIIGTLAEVFSPNFTILYARKNKEELLKEVKRSIKIMSIIGNTPIIILIVCGRDFFRLWQPTQDAAQLQLLSILTCCCLIISGGINCLYNLFQALNMIKENAIAVVVGGAVSIIITFILLKTTGLGIYAVAATSSFVSMIRNIAFTIPFGAKCLKEKWYIFFPDVFRTLIFTGITVAAGYLITAFIPSGGWLLLVAESAAVGLLSLSAGFFIVLNGGDREALKSAVFRKISHRKD